MAYDLSNLKIVQENDSNGNLTFKLTGMPNAGANYWHITSWDYRSYREDENKDWVWSDWIPLIEDFGTQGNFTETSVVTLFTTIEGIYQIKCWYWLQDAEGVPVTTTVELIDEYTIGDPPSPPDNVELEIIEITDTSIKVKTLVNNAINGIAYDWEININGSQKVYDYSEEDKLNGKIYSISNLTPETTYVLQGSYTVYTGNASFQIYDTAQIEFKTLRKVSKAYIYTTKNGIEDWYPATPYIWNGSEWKEVTPYIWNGSEWK